jgi:hypothetical protein
MVADASSRWGAGVSPTVVGEDFAEDFIATVFIAAAVAVFGSDFGADFDAVSDFAVTETGAEIFNV